jgi:hypothetical protein
MALGLTGGLGCYRERLVPECRAPSRRGHPLLFAEQPPPWDVGLGWRQLCVREKILSIELSHAKNRSAHQINYIGYVEPLACA